MHPTPGESYGGGMTLSERQEQRLAKFTPDQIELHKSIIKHIEAEPERWRQSTWVGFMGNYRLLETYNAIDAGSDDYQDFLDKVAEVEVDVNECGTTMCYAGWAAHLSGYRFTMGEGAFLEGEAPKSVSEVARNLLGLDHREAGYLFDANSADTVGQLKALVTDMTGIEFE